MTLHAPVVAPMVRGSETLDRWNVEGWMPGAAGRAGLTVDPRLPSPTLSGGSPARATATRARARVLLADERAISRVAIASWLGTDPALELVGKAGDPEDVEDLADRLQPDAVVLACDRPGHPYAGLARKVRRLAPRSRIVIFSAEHNPRSCAVASSVEADAHVCENDRPDEVLMAVRGRGVGMVVSQLGLTRCVQPDTSAVPALSGREREVLVHLAKGLSAKQVAGELGICPKTVDNHTQRLMKKVGLHSRADVVLFAVRHGYVEA